MRVRATSKGTYGSARHKPDTEFDLVKDSHFDKKWMIQIPDIISNAEAGLAESEKEGAQPEQTRAQKHTLGRHTK